MKLKMKLKMPEEDERKCFRRPSRRSFGLCSTPAREFIRRPLLARSCCG
jgi:hypothetical protein